VEKDKIMMRRLARSIVQILPVLACAGLTAGCGGTAGIGLSTQPTPTPAGQQVGGTVSSPSGRLARRESPPFPYVAGLVSNEALALTGTVIESSPPDFDSLPVATQHLRWVS
jgi:predicted small secreted protein